MIYDWVKLKPWNQVSSSPLGKYSRIRNANAGWTAYRKCLSRSENGCNRKARYGGTDDVL